MKYNTILVTQISLNSGLIAPIQNNSDLETLRALTSRSKQTKLDSGNQENAVFRNSGSSINGDVCVCVW